MDAYRLSRVHRQLRHRLRVTQRELSKSSGVGRNKTSELENGDFARITLSELDNLSRRWEPSSTFASSGTELVSTGFLTKATRPWRPLSVG
jgi:DNA-binding Xre family transcriptional regulator